MECNALQDAAATQQYLQNTPRTWHAYTCKAKASRENITDLVLPRSLHDWMYSYHIGTTTQGIHFNFLLQHNAVTWFGSLNTILTTYCIDTMYYFYTLMWCPDLNWIFECDPVPCTMDGRDRTSNDYDCQKFQQVFTGVPVHIKHDFSAVSKIPNRISRKQM